MKFDYLLRSQAKLKGDYTVYFYEYSSINTPFLSLGTWKLTPKGREKFKHILQVDIDIYDELWGKSITFNTGDQELMKDIIDLLWLAHGLGDIESYDRYIEKTNA